MSRRSAYGLTLPRDEDWRLHGLCRENPDLWTSPAMADIHRAMHICVRHCPVKQQCRAEGEQIQDLGSVYGGVYYSRRGATTTVPPLIRCGWCVRGH